MSWFTDIAGKAEDLLNRVDQTAATALQQNKRSSTSANNSPYKASHNTSYTDSTAPHYTSSQRSNSAALTLVNSTPVRKPLHNPVNSTPKKKPESDDEKLIQFLNDSEAVSAPSFNGQKEEPWAAKHPEGVKFNRSPLKEFKEKEHQSLQKTSATDEIPNTSVASNYSIRTDKTEENIGKTYEEVVSSTAINGENLNTSGDLVLAQDQAKKAEYETKNGQRSGELWNSQISGTDREVRELKEREKDMVASIDSKDSQLAILKVRLHEADQDLKIKSDLAKQLEAENERLIKEHAQSATMQNKTIEVLQEQLQQAEAELNKSKGTLLQYQNEQMQKMGKIEEEHRLLIESYSVLQRKWTEVNDKNKDLSMQLKQSSNSFDALQQEHNDYKIKAQRILQSKEKLISSLKDGHLASEDLERNETTTMLLHSEIETARQERDLVREELRRAQEMLETYRAEMQELEKLSQSEARTVQERMMMVQAQLEGERAQKEELQLMSTQFKEELQLLKDDLTRTKTNLQSRIKDREIEIEKLRRQLTAKSLSSVSQEELESRLHALTENLIQKQTLVESLSTEKNSLHLQLERLERQLREAQNYGMQQHAFVGINNNDSDRKMKTMYLDNPFDSNLTRRVKRVYSCIDSFSIRLGMFFKRYPITRVFVMIYMLLLHFWVMIVLLTYEPEIHSEGFEYPKSQSAL